MIEVEDLRKKLAIACRMLFLADLVDYSGHISVRVPGKKELFLVNPHPISRANVRPDDILVADLDGNRVEGKWNLPSEIPMHTRTYRAREDVQSIAHLHNRMVVILSMAQRPLIPACNTGAFFGPGPLPVYSDPALIHSNEQGDEVARALGVREALILRGHGSLVVGPSVEWTFAACIDLEDSAQKFCFASLLGNVRSYTEDEVNRVAKGRRRFPVIQKIWDHYQARARAAGLLSDLTT